MEEQALSGSKNLAFSFSHDIQCTKQLQLTHNVITQSVGRSIDHRRNSCCDVTSDTPNVSSWQSGDKAALSTNYEQDHLYDRHKPKGGYNLNMYPADTTYPAIQGEGVESWVQREFSQDK